MTVGELAKVLDAKMLTAETDLSRSIGVGYTCDLLSWVMSHGEADMAWITVQTHMNVIAVASLMEMSCVIVPESIQVGDDIVAKAQEEGVAVLSAAATAYEICGIMTQLGIAHSPRR